MVFTRDAAQVDNPVKIPCGQCIGCRLERSRQWAMRCVHESSLYEENSFITLTYAENPPFDTISKRAWQDFMKSLRHKLHPKKIRFFMCGEYGDEKGRPHYHAIIFNHRFTDQKFHKTTDAGENLYTSELLDQVWQKGYCYIGEVNFKTAAYVARYALKKNTGEQAKTEYERESTYTCIGIQDKISEYTLQSRNPGIARPWFEKYKDDLDKGFITINGTKMAPPKYYDDCYLAEDELQLDNIKEKRRQSIDQQNPEQQLNRLRVKETIKLKKMKSFTRNLNHEN